ncbi:MAG: histidinol-phosphatase [Firmicutes bacterium]|nr:histidinol-phosphatase [Bacillota bacterium]
MYLCDLHIHTNYCDGADTPEEIVLEAIQKGMSRIGFSAHSYTYFDESYCIKKDKIQAYKDEISQLKEKYNDKIEILCGIEQDFYSNERADGYDYVIGSVHYLKTGDKFIPIDLSADCLTNAVRKYYNGDFYKIAEDYFSTVAKIKNAQIIGHFDLITKFNEGFCLFDESDERYVNAYKNALDMLLKQDVIFEINTGAISRGFKNEPYPSRVILDYIRKNGGKTILSSDCHKKEALMINFDKYQSWVF